MSHNPSHIIVTPKGLELQVQLLKEMTTFNFPQIRSPQSVIRPRKLNNSTSVQTSLTPFPLPRAGYFGPKEQTISLADPDQDYLLYPNYLHKSPKDNVQRHFCVWKPNSTTKTSKSIEPVIPKGRYVHHTLFNHAVDTKVAEDPNIEKLNRITFGGGSLNTSHVQTPQRNTRRMLDATEIRESMVMDGHMSRNQSQMFNKSMVNNNNHLRSTASWGRFRGTSTVDWATKEEKYIEKHQTHQKEYERLLERFAEEAVKSRLKHEENQNEQPEFIKKMKNADKDMQQLKGKKFNEDSRYVKRLKNFQAEKYEKIWKAHEWSQLNSTVTGDKFIAKKGVRGGPLYNTSGIANETHETDKSINSNQPKMESEQGQGPRRSKKLSKSGSPEHQEDNSEAKLKGVVTPREDDKFLDFVKI